MKKSDKLFLTIEIVGCIILGVGILTGSATVTLGVVVALYIILGFERKDKNEDKTK